MGKKTADFLPAAMMVLLFGMIAFVTNLAAPMGIIVKEQFHTTSFLGMLGNFANFIAYAVMGLPAGRLLSRIGYKKTALYAIMVGFAGVLIQYISGIFSSFVIYLAGAFVAGFSMCMLNTVINPMLNIIGGGGRKGNQLIQIGGTVSSLMAMTVPVLVGFLIGEVTKDTEIADVNMLMFIAMGVFLLIGASLWLMHIPEPAIYRCDDGYTEDSPWRYPHFVLGVIAIFCGVGIEVGIPGTMNFYLVDDGLAPSSAGMVVGTYYVLMLAGRFIGVMTAGKIRSKDMLTIASVCGIILLFLAIYTDWAGCVRLPVLEQSEGIYSIGVQYIPLNAVFLVLCGLCSSVLWGVIFNLAVEGLGPLVSRASGIFMMMVCGGGIIPLLQNRVADISGYLPSYWILIICFVYLLFYSVFGCRLKRNHI